MLNNFFAAVDIIVHGYGRMVDKHIGDTVMAVFGAPVALTDDPERALRAAGEIHDAVGRLSPPLKVHIGVASGQVVASSTGSTANMEYPMTGDSVIPTGRLPDLAGPEQTLASATVRREVGDRFTGEALGGQGIAGLLEPVTVYRLDRIAAEHADQKPFVGRAREVQLAAAIDRCLDISIREARGIVGGRYARSLEPIWEA